MNDPAVEPTLSVEEPRYDDLIANAGSANDPESGFSADVSDRFVVEDLPEDHSENIGHSLPSPEEAKANVAIDKGAGRNYKKLAMTAFLGLIGVGALVGIIVGISKAALKKKQTPSVELTSRHEEVIDFLFAERVSTLPNMKETHHPASKAAMFVADGDAFQLDYKESPEQARRFIERYVLSVLYYHFNGDQWNYHLNFLSAQDHCNWYGTFETAKSDKTILMGVLCDEDGYVQKINLSQNNLAGRGIPDEVKNLMGLESFHMYFNSISGPFPEALRDMTSLKSIAFMDTGMSGPIPAWLGNMQQLTTLALGNNAFNGEVPDSLKNLVNMKILGLDDNDGLTGNINRLFYSMRNLEALYLEDNAFSGQIPSASTWPSIIELDVSNNMIDEAVPEDMINHPHLVVLDAHKNMLGGTFPTDLFANTKLEVLALQHNTIGGTVPDRLPFLQNLKHFDVSFNNLRGTLPDNIGEMTTIRYWGSTNNPFEEQPMPNFERLTNLMDLSMKHNNIKSKFPEWVGGLQHLRLLDLDANHLSGSIPTWIGLATNLQHVLLNRNELTGSLPPQLANLKKLDVLLVDNNNIQGSADHICDASDVHPTYFTADCYPGRNGERPEIDCRCCSTCCLDDDPTCNNFAWTSNLDPVWEYGYLRKSYSFSLANAPAAYSKEGDADPTDPIDDWTPPNGRRFMLTEDGNGDVPTTTSVLGRELGMQ